MSQNEQHPESNNTAFEPTEEDAQPHIDLTDAESLVDTAAADIIAYGQALSRVRTLHRSTTRQGSIDMDGHFGPESSCHIPRDTLRTLGPYKVQFKQRIQRVILAGKFFGQQMIWGANEDMIDQAYVAYQQRREVITNSNGLEDDESPEALEKHGNALFARVFVSICDAEKTLCQAEKGIETHLDNFLGGDAFRAVSLLDHIRSDDFDNLAYQPLLAFLAKNTLDPLASHLIDTAITALEDLPHLYLPIFCSLLDNLDSQDPSDEAALTQLIGAENTAWLAYMVKIAATPENSTVLSSAVLQQQPWPPPLQERFLRHFKGFTAELRQTYKELAEQHNVKINFYVDANDVDTVQITDTEVPKKRTKKNGRTSPKTALNRLASATRAEDNETPPGLSPLIAHPSKGETSFKAGEATEPADYDTLLDLPMIDKYLRKHSSDPDLPTDIERMLLSIINEPWGNGATPMNKLKINLDVAQKNLQVWHLNPNDRHQLSIGDTARNTRIYYVTYKQDDRLVIGFLKVTHKSDKRNSTNLFT